MNDDDRQRIARLVGEGQQITKVWRESFPQYSYGDVYWAAYGEGKRSAQGIQENDQHSSHRFGECQQGRTESVDQGDRRFGVAAVPNYHEQRRQAGSHTKDARGVMVSLRPGAILALAAVVLIVGVAVRTNLPQ